MSRSDLELSLPLAPARWPLLPGPSPPLGRSRPLARLKLEELPQPHLGEGEGEGVG